MLSIRNLLSFFPKFKIKNSKSGKLLMLTSILRVGRKALGWGFLGLVLFLAIIIVVEMILETTGIVQQPAG